MHLLHVWLVAVASQTYGAVHWQVFVVASQPKFDVLLHDNEPPHLALSRPTFVCLFFFKWILLCPKSNKINLYIYIFIFTDHIRRHHRKCTASPVDIYYNLMSPHSTRTDKCIDKCHSSCSQSYLLACIECAPIDRLPQCHIELHWGRLGIFFLNKILFNFLSSVKQ